ncbi:MAG: peptidase-C39 like family protein [Legionellales bacterium]|nr:peptidase-C39 like family protein [Legionellales bacterium]
MIPIKILNQPTNVTCGPTSLHAIYQYYGDNISLDQVVDEVVYVDGGGTLGVLLATHALKRGYKAVIYTYNINVFDPTWFAVPKGEISEHIIEKLKKQAKVKSSGKLSRASASYIEFIKLGGKIAFEDLTSSLLSKYFRKGLPILTGLSATYLYQSAREVAPDDFTTRPDDVRGKPCGHFVVLCGYNEERDRVLVADPSPEHPEFNEQYYSVKVNRLINSIMLGILTYDANFLIIEKG